jgi:hypothetical protein
VTTVVLKKKHEILRIFLSCLGLRGFTKISEEGKEINEKEISAHISEGFLEDDF